MFALLFAVDSSPARLARKFNKMRKVYREALPVLSSKQKWETVLLESSASRHMAEARRGAKRPRSSRYSRRWPTAPVC